MSADVVAKLGRFVERWDRRGLEELLDNALGDLESEGIWLNDALRESEGDDELEDRLGVLQGNAQIVVDNLEKLVTRLGEVGERLFEHMERAS